MKFKLILSLAVLGAFLNLQAQQSNQYITLADQYVILEVQAFKDSIKNNNVQLIDVRTPEEYKEGHIENAENIDFFSADFMSKFNAFDRQKPIYIYCRSGNRSKKSGAKLSAMGFKKIYDLKGGILKYD